MTTTVRSPILRAIDSESARLSKAKSVLSVLRANCGDCTWQQLQDMDAEAREEKFKTAFTELTKICHPDLDEAQRNSKRLSEVKILRLYDLIPKEERERAKSLEGNEEMNED